MLKLFAAAGVLLLAMLVSSSTFAQSAPPSEAARKAELDAALQAAGKAGTAGPSDVALIDQATLKLPAGDFFIPRDEGARVLRALGNLVNDQMLVGVVIGVGVALAATRLLGALLFGVKPVDPLAFAAMSIMMIGVGMLASYVPARRASGVNPMESLRSD